MRISIITLTLDSPQFFEETIGSINAEGPFELEHIVVHDGDDAFIRQLEQSYPVIKVLKGEGAGATTAAAQAVEAATGDFILFLHSDDRLRSTFWYLSCGSMRPQGLFILAVGWCRPI